MRDVLIILMFVGIISSCESNKSVSNSESEAVGQEVADTIRIENKELEYEIIILEVGFESWLATQRPRWYYTQSVLENRNKYFVLEWNRRAGFPGQYDPMLYNQPINYQMHIDYGKEVNYLLYMYFEFFQERYKQRL